MAKIKASLLILDPSFFFYVNIKESPYEITIKVPEGNLKIMLDVPSSSEFENDKGFITNADLCKHLLEEAEKGEKPILGITCSILLSLEQNLEGEIIDSYKRYKEFTNAVLEKGFSDESEKKLDPEKIVIKNGVAFYEDKDAVPYPEHERQIFSVCRKYLKKFLLSLRENGNVCKLKFFDYGDPSYDTTSGLFNKYYYIWQISDDSDEVLFSYEPFLVGRKKEELSKIMFSMPIDGKIEKRDSLINGSVWQRISEDMVSEFKPDVAKTFLLDAQDEALSMNISLAIISAAVACEIFTKRFISDQARRSGNEFYDYVIDEIREVSVVDLLNIALKSLMGFSVKEQNGLLWNDLKRLFQARNKVAHEGKCYYMSSSGKTKYPVDYHKTIHFIERVYELFGILVSHKNRD